MVRGRQTATLSRLAHETFTDAAVGRLLDRLESETAFPADSDEAALVRVTRRLYEQSVRVPTALVSEFEEHAATTYRAWTAARPANDFLAVRPLLEKTLELSRRWANCFPGYESIADPLIALDDYGMKASGVRDMFAALRARLVPLMRAITSRPPADVSCLRLYAPVDQQLAFGVKVVEACGYDFERGRLDLTAHPFTTKFSLGDVRITTRVSKTDAPGRRLHHASRGWSRALPTGRPQRPRWHAARLDRVLQRRRKPVSSVGKPRGPQPRVLGALLSHAAAGVSPAIRRCRSRHVLPRHQLR
jgi:carboxypeptidase Taq